MVPRQRTEPGFWWIWTH